ncbi:acyl-CoA dehydrogenase family protein [Halomarina oriensis]|uniref:Acyl-CoA dehydrogenase n=1 Tax=Halomarina oriensis TaxID=671145 RepID=A0A6B0GU68_9EURY|nr:acyl-CoA dehydrogenase family protein [Halomarina oriensis]MWG35258.1 acyl-CoA dehydrogenase [Halomarina oriensis]
MPFRLTDDQRELRDELRTFTDEEVIPVASTLDHAGTYPNGILSGLADRGVTGLTIGESYGGRGQGNVELVVTIEELSAGLMSVGAALALHLGVAAAVEEFGTERQRDEYLPEMARFETVGALGLSEENAGSDKTAMETRAERDGSGWSLTGHKQWVTNVREADVVLLYAKTGPEDDAPENVSAFLVPTDDLSVAHEWDAIGGDSVPTARVEFEDLHVPDDRMVGQQGTALTDRRELTGGVNLPARAVGIARASLDVAVVYAGEREQFGQPIGEFQGVEWRLAEMAERVETARLLTLRAAEAADRGDADAGTLTSMAKVHATEAAVENASDAMDVHGGVGFTSEYPVERYFRDAKLLTVAGGPNDVHRNTVADAVSSE